MSTKWMGGLGRSPGRSLVSWGCLGLGSFLRSTGMPKKVYDVLGEVLGLITLSGVERSYLKIARMSTKRRRGRRHSRGRSLWLGDLI